MTTRRILVTGASGFIGANLVHRLMKEGSDVHAVVRDRADLSRLDNALSGITVHDIDLQDAASLTDLLERVRPDVIYHAAFAPGHPVNRDARTAMLHAGVVGTINLLEAATQVGFERLINLGSSLEYGVQKMPLHEGLPLSPSTFRGLAKAAAALACSAYSRWTHLPIVTLRLFSVYGYWESTSRFIPSAILAALEDRPFSLTPPGCSHDWIFIEDVVAACLKAATAAVGEGEVINVGSGTRATNEEVVEIVERLTGRKLAIRRDYPPSPCDTPFWQADIRLARQRLGWQPEHSLGDGLEKTIVWFRKQSSAWT